MEMAVAVEKRKEMGEENEERNGSKVFRPKENERANNLAVDEDKCKDKNKNKNRKTKPKNT